MSSKIEISEELAAEITSAVIAFVDLVIARIEQSGPTHRRVGKQLGRTSRNASKPSYSNHPHG